ncbi:hypothetical protein [Metamycoplasma equirhinis]|uniref:hypothetical protein n=1 Tax=Metamycoplasma equirhinis TaxID=92402 RepID=UPI002573735E|nr:hypothetical protein [Metamycoplasma equirhinis]BDX52597.1 hypothetical protein JPM7_2040 [Metamycoplasma equirhinis]
MKNIIENLASTLEISEDVIKEKLGLNDASDSKEIAKKLGVYSLFVTKDEHANYINSKLANKEELINSYSQKIYENNELINQQKNEIDKLNNDLQNNVNYKNAISNLIKKEWENLGIKRDFEKENINLQKIDFSNLRKSIADYAYVEGLAFKKPNFDDFVYSKEKEENQASINAIDINGAVKK